MRPDLSQFPLGAWAMGVSSRLPHSFQELM